MVVISDAVVAEAPLVGVNDDDDADVDSLSSHADDVTGVNDGVSGVRSDIDETVDSEEAVDIFNDSSVIDDDGDGDANSEAQRRRFDSTVDFCTNDAMTNALPVAWRYFKQTLKALPNKEYTMRTARELLFCSSLC